MIFSKLKKYMNQWCNASLLYSIMIFTIVFICVCFANKFEYGRKVDFLLPNICSLFIGIISCLFIFFILKKLNKIEKHKIDRFIKIFTFFFTIFLFWLARNYSFKTGWDVLTLLTNAELIANNNIENLSNSYFSMCPNNILLTQLFSIAYWIAKIVRISDGYNFLLLFQSFIYSFTGYLVYKISCILFNDNSMNLFAWIIYILLIGFSPWIVIPYSDSFAMLFVIIIAYIYLKIYQISDIKKKCAYIVLLSIFSIIGYFIKPQIIIILIAVVIITIISNFSTFKVTISSKRNYIYAFLFIISCVITFFITNIIIENSGFTINKEAKFGISHYLMMGFNYEGGGVWNKDDVAYSNSFETNNERNKANLEIFKSRIEKMGFSGVMNLLTRKTLTNYNDGTFAYGKEGLKFVLEDYKTGNNKIRIFLNKIYKIDGEYFKEYQLTMQIIWMGVLFFNICALNPKKDLRIYVMQLSIIGLTIFELLFEARARYLFAYVPIYILIATIGIDSVTKFIKELKN